MDGEGVNAHEPLPDDTDSCFDLDCDGAGVGEGGQADRRVRADRAVGEVGVGGVDELRAGEDLPLDIPAGVGGEGRFAEDADELGAATR